MALTAARRRRLPLSQFADRTNRKYPLMRKLRRKGPYRY